MGGSKVDTPPAKDAKAGRGSKVEARKPRTARLPKQDASLDKASEEEDKKAAAPQVVKSEKCVPMDGRKFLGCPDIKFWAHNYFGFETADVVEAFDSLYTKLMPMVKSFISDIPGGCFPTLKTEMCGIFFPSCSDTCQERKTCTSSCRRIQSECGILVESLKMEQPGGMMEGFVKQQFPNPKVYKVIQTMLTSVTCEGDNFDSDDKQCATVLSSSKSCSNVSESKVVHKRLFPT